MALSVVKLPAPTPHPAPVPDGADFITQFIEITEQLFSPHPFRLWSAISLLGMAVERRVWVQTGRYETFPNNYIFLVAAPGVGKQVIDFARKLVSELPDRPLCVAPHSVTKASLMDAIVKATGRVAPPGGGVPVEYHSLAVLTEEVQLFLPSYDADFLGVLNYVYNNPSLPLSETRRTGSVREINASLPQLNLLAGVQPGWMAGTLPELAWSTGLMARVVMVYVEDQPFYDIFAEPQALPSETPLQHQLVKLSRQYGRMEWTPGARAVIQQWHLAGDQPRPGHSKLMHYTNRRPMHVTKLATISALSRGATRWIDELDLTRAFSWLFDAERTMPDVFRAMAGKNDQAVIEELHGYVTGVWRMNGQKPLHERNLVSFLAKFVPADRVGKLLDVAERSGVVARMAGTEMWVPKAKTDWGVE